MTRWLDEREARAWRSLQAVLQPLETALNRQLARDSALSTADYTVLVVLSEADHHRMRIRELVCATGWEKSRVSHQIRRMETRGLVVRQECPTDARGAFTRLTSAPSIETAPSFSPDGSQIVFESDRSGTQQLYIMPAGGGEPTRISFDEGARYSTPVWSPRGDLIAFTKQTGGEFHIGVMRADGSDERLLTSSYLDEGPTWAPNGRVLMFSRETPGGESRLYTVDITGRILQPVPYPLAASDPAWSPLLN